MCEKQNNAKRTEMNHVWYVCTTNGNVWVEAGNAWEAESKAIDLCSDRGIVAIVSVRMVRRAGVYSL